MKKFNLAILLMMVLVITTGCIKSVVRFEADGSGSLEVGFNLSLQNLEEAGDASGEGTPSEFEDIEPLLESGMVIVDEQTGITFSAEERLENGSQWTYLIFGVPTQALWGKLDAVASEILPDDDGDLPTDTDSLAVAPDITITDTSIRVEMVIPSSVDPDARGDDLGLDELFNALIQVSYEIEMPGELIDHNGQIDSLTGNPVWIIDPTDPNDLIIFAESTLE